MMFIKRARKPKTIDVKQLELNMANATRLRGEMLTMSYGFTAFTDKALVSTRKEKREV
jgi:hypothetical protein